jgi:hypothetical protein
MHGFRIQVSFVVLACLSTLTLAASSEQIRIPRVEQMPNFPQPYKMRDWKKVARDYDAFVFDFNKQGEHLPLIWWDTGFNDSNSTTFGLPSYVGNPRHYETITCMGAINGATLVGIDKSNQNGRNWVLMAQNYFNNKNSLNLYLNSASDATGKTFWYEIFPNILFYRILSCYPGTGDMEKQFYIVADRWYDACVGMGGKTSPPTVPNFDHTSFNFNTMKPVDNGVWKEADSAGAIAWIEYMAYTRSGDKKYIDAARWGIEYLDRTTQNPFYEVLFPQGVYIAARMNAEQGTNYNVEKLVNWCFNGDNWRKWGIPAGKWGDMDCGGLVGSVWKEGYIYTFSMNTFNMANSLVPLVRYDQRFARAIGKWMLNASNSARFFYANALPDDQQTDAEWSRKYDPDSCIAYEGLQQRRIDYDRVDSDYKTISGRIKTGTFKETMFTNKEYEVLEEGMVGKTARLEHIWKIPLSKAAEYELTVVGHCGATGSGEAFEFSHASSPEGPYKRAFVISSREDTGQATNLKDCGTVLYLKIEDSNSDCNDTDLDTFYADDIYICSKSSKSPYATGDAKSANWSGTNLGLYGSSFVGIFGGIIETTNVEGILRLDCLVTDYFHGKAYPTYLYYNPYPEKKSVKINLGTEHKSIYDAVKNKFIVTDAAEIQTFSIEPDSAVVAVLTPASGKIKYDGNKTLIDGIVVDYTNGK